jgi:hypothetical protein
MYRMQGETSSPEVSARVSQTALQESPAKKQVQALQKFKVSKRHVHGGNLGAKDPKQAKKSYHSYATGRQGIIRQTQNLIAPFFLMGWRHMQVLKCIQVRS